MVEILTNILSYFVENQIKWIIPIIILVVGIVVIRIISKYLARFFDKTNLDKTLGIFAQKTVKMFLWLILIIIILGNLGFNMTGFIAGLGVAGIIIGFATKDIFSNLAAGMFLLISRPFKVGDTVEVTKIKGKVKEINISTCVIITETNEYVIIPNSKIWGGPIKNLSRINQRK